ncbi:hypothetical protein M422DRAFT_784466 [Sphaerobolus stellatus SS14]|uniref:PH domain-containing protein n=1 Tax=Sphaerobolus stellatus (strain SS14) TaxID=990650 RepID=A0A0C9UJ58_SPHS4|nr:hypothetical protein M422DRAFT_784466 [Sphaerobolus stellatus SS14]
MPSPVASSSSSIAGSTVEPLYQIKLLAALRSGDPALIHPILTEISRDRGKSIDGSVDLGAAALHLAIRCASYDTIQLLLQNRSISANSVHPAESGTTALHLAASLGRADVVSLLLEQDGVDDTVRDSKGRTPKDVARSKEVHDVIQDSQTLFRASFFSLLRTYILSPQNASPPPALLAALSSPRASLLDLSYVDDASGTTLLHEAARRKDLSLIELAIRAGADVFVRDRRGRPVTDAAGKDDRVKAYLRQYTNRDQTLINPPATTEPPSLKGYLNKYTNVARGYGTRWFVLKDGVLSYYRHQDDENLTCRGSISMTSASLKVSNSDKLRFEVHSLPTHRPTSSHSTGQQAGIQKWYMKANHPAEAARWAQAVRKSIEWYQSNGESPQLGVAQEILTRNGSISVGDLGSMKSSNRRDSKGRSSSIASSIEANEARVERGLEPEPDREYARSVGSSASSGAAVPPHNGAIDLQANNTITQLELTTKLAATLNLPPSAPKQLKELEAALKDSIAQAQQVTNEYVRMVKEREQWYKEQLEKERDRNAVWEESLSVVVREGELLENELRKRGRAKAKRRSMLFAPDATASTIRQRSIRELPALPVMVEPQQPASPVSPTATTAPPLPVTKPAPIVVLPDAPPIEPAPMSPLSSDSDSDGEDEFFDAIESNNLPNLVVSETLKSAGSAIRVSRVPEDQVAYQAYSHLRERLPIKDDQRPSTSLWQVLKGSIGKDLTKISFPVYFNEPTSMLQRMAEDMEFSECLDAAAEETDPHRRIAFVAAFAMSNYSSTIGRIAKPFNPMLGETFEYVRLDKKYRYYSEQVSHHPPISACWAEGPAWKYYGEVDAQNKFMGKSFEIRPTGVAHAELKLPGEDKYEHYTWKKVTTNVSGFILGNTTIDHYGEMRVTNHRTGDTCILTFKPRGWRGKDAYEISGHVLDLSGTITYHIAGRWDSQLVARKAEMGRLQPNVHPNVNIDEPLSPSAPEYILLWRNTEKPKAPFNLTPFAITLNDCPEDLRPYLPYTDCRLRPDQRAFELGRYDRANELKSKQEDFQRATRKNRELGILPPHKPRWFEARTDGDTGERVWMPLTSGSRLQYWQEREKVYYTDGKGGWNNVEKIFIEDEP